MLFEAMIIVTFMSGPHEGVGQVYKKDDFNTFEACEQSRQDMVKHLAALVAVQGLTAEIKSSECTPAGTPA